MKKLFNVSLSLSLQKLSFSATYYVAKPQAIQLEAEEIDPHRDLCMHEVPRHCDNRTIRQQEEGWYDDEQEIYWLN